MPENKMADAPFDTTPPEVVCIIMEHMDAKTLIEFSLTCKTYRRLLRHVNVKGRVYCKDADTAAKAKLRCCLVCSN